MVRHVSLKSKINGKKKKKMNERTYLAGCLPVILNVSHSIIETLTS